MSQELSRLSLADSDWSFTLAGEWAAEAELSELLRGSDPGWLARLAGRTSVPQPVKDAFAAGPKSAVVPGNAHDDLLRHGLIPDPYLGDNESGDLWIGFQNWLYATTLPPTPKGYERVDLVADGLDTFADIRLDGTPVGTTKNQHRTYRFDITERIRPGAELSVEFSSAYFEAAKVEQALGEGLPSNYGPFNYIRKMASNFGWDWGPNVATAGIWKDLRLESWSTARLADVRAAVTVAGPASHSGHVRLSIDLDRTAAGASTALSIEAAVDGFAAQEIDVPAGVDHATLDIDLENVELWWPHGMGRQNLYPLAVTLRTAEGAELDHWRKKIGFRSIELETSQDDVGSSFRFVVAGRPVYARGYDWIPDDLLISRVTRDDYRARLQDVVDCHANVLRVWGGGIFEKDEFYETCDEFGIMVWQDCLFACAAYPETDDLATEIDAEERDNASRLMSHPSIVLWNGCNENLWGYWDWGWQRALHGRGWGAKYYLDLQPRLFAELDPGRPYWPGSPYSGDWAIHPDNPNHGCFHSWIVWNETDYSDYRLTKPRFVSEFGWCGPASYATLRDAIGTEHLEPHDPVLNNHFKAKAGEWKIWRSLVPRFHVPSDFDSWHFVTQLNQARANACAIRYWRSLWPVNAGAIMWQLNDCWPVISWAAVDSAGRRKPNWYAVRDAFADRLATVQPSLASGAGPKDLELCCVNNTCQPWQALVTLRRVYPDGGILAEWHDRIDVAPDSVARICMPNDLAIAGGLSEVVVVDCEGRREVWPFVSDKDFAFSKPEYDVFVSAGDDAGEAIVTVVAKTLVRDLLFQADRLGPRATSEAEFVTLLPGESHEWLVRNLDSLPSANDLKAPVLMSVAEIELANR